MYNSSNSFTNSLKSSWKKKIQKQHCHKHKTGKNMARWKKKTKWCMKIKWKGKTHPSPEINAGTAEIEERGGRQGGSVGIYMYVYVIMWRRGTTLIPQYMPRAVVGYLNLISMEWYIQIYSSKRLGYYLWIWVEPNSH